MKLSVHYTPKMLANADSYSPSAGKPALVMASWAESGLPLNIIEPPPVSVDQFSLAHDRAFVEGVLSGGINNGFGNTLPSVAASLPYMRRSKLLGCNLRDALLRSVNLPWRQQHPVHVGY